MAADRTADAHRGKDPASTVDTTTPFVPDSANAPDPERLEQVLRDLAGKGDDKRHRPNREDVLPYLVIRDAPGDRGARPAWPPTACWESPDILLIDAAYTGEFDPAHCVGNPTSGNTYRAFVRVFNLGRLPAVGTQVTLYWVDPGFFGPNSADYEPQLIGGAFVELADRTRAESVQVVEIAPAWQIPYELTGHECLMAVVDCIADPCRGVFDSNNDRHVGQRNLTIAAGAMPMTALLNTLGARIPRGGMVQVVHGGDAVVPLLRAVGGVHRHAEPVAAPVMDQVAHGAVLSDTLHLVTAVRRAADIVVAPTEAMVEAVPAIEALEIARYLHAADRQVLRNVAVTGTGDTAHEVLGTSLQRILDIGNLEAGSIAAALGGGRDAAHLLRFVGLGRRRSVHRRLLHRRLALTVRLHRSSARIITNDSRPTRSAALRVHSFASWFRAVAAMSRSATRALGCRPTAARAAASWPYVVGKVHRRSQQGARVEQDPHQAKGSVGDPSRSSRSAAQSASAGPVTISARSAPRRPWRRRTGPNWATSRPLTDTTMVSPAAA